MLSSQEFIKLLRQVASLTVLMPKGEYDREISAVNLFITWRIFWICFLEVYVLRL